MKISFMLICLLVASLTAQAAVPFEDYNFYCSAGDTSGSGQLEIEAGVNPLGGFDVSMRATEPWTDLNGAFIVAESFAAEGGASVLYKSVPDESLFVNILIRWSQDIGADRYPGTLTSENINGGNPIDLICRAELQSEL